MSRGGPRRPKNENRSISSSGGKRRKTVLVKAQGRGLSSTRWLQRQLNDPYVLAAKEAGYRSRAAFKLIELNEKFDIFSIGDKVVDLGAAPGGWSQVASENIGKHGEVLGLDLQFIDPINGVKFLQMDVYAKETIKSILETLNGPVNVVLSDMATRSTGHASTDHLRVISLAEAAADLAAQILAPNGVFIAKVFKGGTESELLKTLKKQYERVKHAKPPSSRATSAEEYVIARGFRYSNY